MGRVEITTEKETLVPSVGPLIADKKRAAAEPAIPAELYRESQDRDKKQKLQERTELKVITRRDGI